MFDICKAIGKYQGIPPYASELYDMYQPLLGLQSDLTKIWLQKLRAFVNPLTQRILGANIIPKRSDIGLDPEGTLDDQYNWRDGCRALPIGAGTLNPNVA